METRIDLQLLARTMEPGIYTIDVDVENSGCDRRTRHDWRLDATWEAGTFFLVEAVYDPFAKEEGRPEARIGTEVSRLNKYRHQTIAVRDPLRHDLGTFQEVAMKSLVPILRRIESPWATYMMLMLDRKNLAFELLREAFFEGLVSLSWIERTAERIYQMSEDGGKVAVEGEGVSEPQGGPHES